MATNLRTETERLLVRLNRELGIEQKHIGKLSDYELLSFINMRLIKLDCVPYTEEEMNVMLAKQGVDQKN